MLGGCPPSPRHRRTPYQFPQPRGDDDPSSSGVQPAEPGPSLPAPAARASTTMPSLASLEKPFQPSTVCAAYVMLDYLCWGRTAHSPLCAVTSGRATAAVPVFVCHSASPVSALYTICFVFYINRQCASALYFYNGALPYCVWPSKLLFCAIYVMYERTVSCALEVSFTTLLKRETGST